MEDHPTVGVYTEDKRVYLTRDERPAKMPISLYSPRNGNLKMMM